MSISLIKIPDPIVSVGNIVPVIVQASDPKISGSKSQLFLTFTDHPADGDKLVFTWLKKNLILTWTFTSTWNVNSNQYDLPLFPTNGPNGELYYLFIFQLISSNVYLDMDFNFSIETSPYHKLIMTAKNDGFKIVDGSFTGGFSFFTYANGYDYSEILNYKVGVQILQLKDSVYVELGKDIKSVISNNQTTFNLSDYLLPEFSEMFTHIIYDWQGFTGFLNQNAILDFAIRLFEANGIPSEYSTLGQKLPFKGIYGKIPQWFSQQSLYSIFSWDETFEHKKLGLLSCSNRKKIPSWGSLNISFLNAYNGGYYTDGPFVFINEITMVDGSVIVYRHNEGFTDEITDFSICQSKFQPKFFIDNLLSDSDPRQVVKITHYIAKIVGGFQLERISEKLELLIEHEQSDSLFYFHFKNMFGRFDSILTYGKPSQSFKLDRSSSIDTRLQISNLDDGKLSASKDYVLELTQTISLSTGSFNDEMTLNLVRDFLSSEEIFLEKGLNQVYSIRLSKENWDEKPVGNSGKLYNVSFAVEIVSRENFYYNA